MQVCVLGSVGVRIDGTEVDVGARLRRLLAALAVSNGSVVSTGRLADIVWAGDPPDGAEKTLRSYMTRLRRALGSDDQRIVFREPGYVIELSTDELDSASFDDELDRALRHLRTAEVAEAHRLLETALGRWRGPAYAGYADEEWFRPECVRLEERLVEAREALIEAKLASGSHDEAAADAESLVEAEPLRERPRELLMRAMYAGGRQAEALRVYASYRRHLIDETGLDPSAQITELERRIARGDPSLGNRVTALRGYEVGERIGEGAFAVVHRAVQPGVERDVAIKIIRSELADRPDFIRRFEFEARTVARIEHPNVVPLYDFWREPGAAYLVMRLLSGGTVEQAVWARGPYSPEQTMRLLADVGGALDAAHRAGVVHRDVRPGNLLLDTEGTTYLADFGIALPTAAVDDLPNRSPAYAAPEVLRGEPAGAAGDIFSLGVTTFEVLAGRLPFADTLDHRQLVHRQLSDPLPSVRAVRTDLPSGVDDILARATAKAPDNRYPTVAAFVDDLRGALTSAPSGTRRTPLDWHRPVPNPYVGLHAFDEGDEHLFFGRERLVAELVDALGQRPMVTVVGPSGSGKSSVVRAGVLPAVRRGAIAGSDRWFVATMVPGTDPIAALETALLRVAVNPPASLRQQLGEAGGLLRAIRRVLPDERTRVLLVVDQFEELFTQARDPAERDRFLVELAGAITDPESPLQVIATLRADHYDAPLRQASIAELVTRGTVTVRPMTPDELERAVSLPASSVGVDVEPALASDLVAGVSSLPAALPLLQFSLTELFDRRVASTMLLSTHHELGGLTGALAARAERILAAGGPDDEAEARRIFGRLVTFGEGADDTRRRALRSEFGDRERTASLIDEFVAARLLTADRDPSSREPTVEVAHEALLRDWPRLHAWLVEDRELRRSVGAIGAAATVWDRGGRQTSDLYRGRRLDSASEVADTNPDWLRPVDHEFLDASRDQADAEQGLERRRVRRLRRLVAGTAAALVVALIAGGLAFSQQRRADREARAAEARADEATAATADAELAELIARSAAAAADRPEQSLLLAVEAYRQRPGPETVGALLDGITNGRLGRQVGAVQRLPDNNCAGLAIQRRIGPDGLREFATVDGQVLSNDLGTGVVTNHGPAPAPCAGWWEDAETGYRSASSSTLSEHWTQADGGPWTFVDRALSGGALEPVVVNGRVLHAQSFIRFAPAAEVAVVDAVTLEKVGTASDWLTFGLIEPVPVTAASRSAGLFAVGKQVLDGRVDDPDPEGVLVVLDAETGAEVAVVNRPAPVTAVAFADDGRTVLAGADDGAVFRVDVTTGNVTTELSMDDPVDVIAVGTRPDGLVVAVGSRSIQLFDESGSRRGAPIDIPTTDEARIRPDGSVLIVPRADPDIVQVIDPNRGPLVEQGWDVAADGLVGFGDGRAAVVEPSGAAEVVDLASGKREPLELMNGDGEPFDAIAARPEPGGFLAWNDGTTVARWGEGDVVEEVPIWTGSVNVTQTGGAIPTGLPVIGGEFGAPRVGGGFAGDGAIAVFEGEVPQGMYRFDPRPGSLSVLTALENPPFSATAVAPAPLGGLYVALSDGTVRQYDRSGTRVDRWPTTFEDPTLAVTDPTTGAVALGGENGAVVLDPSDGSVQPVTDVDAVASLGFARDGSVLVLVESNGTVRLWDTERGERIGTVWIGDGTAPSSPPWYDESTDTVWVATSGQILQFSLDPERWVERVCELVARELTADEWNRLVPGDTPQRPACA
jgi:DNA-binding SARP family transcriptional activator/WD40 repeat protein